MNSVKTLLTIVVGLFVSSLYAEETCFIAMNANTGEIVAKNGAICETHISPCSTFKIPLSLMGYESNILQDETHPTWSFTDKEKQVPHYPKSWMSNSVVWYSQILTTKLGMKRFSDFVDQFEYGNQDISGDKGKGNGLTQAWLSSSLKISPYEQLIFLKKVVTRKLPLSQHAYDMTQNILFLEELENGWKYYGKTGTGAELDKQFAWFVGWIQKADQSYVFAYSIIDTQAVPSREERVKIVKEFLKGSGILISES